MAQRFYNSQQAAEMLGVPVDEIKDMMQRRELHGYRDGADWKFKVEEVEKLVEQRRTPAPADDDEALLSEVELGGSDAGASGTVIGDKAGAQGGESDLKLADSDLSLDEPAGDKDDVGSKVSQFEELDLALDEDLTLEDSSVSSASKEKGSGSGNSAVDLTGKELEDDDVVLGGSGAGSDITIGGDSGISLVDPADSGLSLEEPIESAAPAEEESLELGEDDMLSFAEASGIGRGGAKQEDDFELTPLEEVTDTEDSESGSQVIALDTEGEGDEAATVIAGGSPMAAMLDEDLGAQPDMMGAPMGGQGFAMQPGPAGGMLVDAAALPEKPYTGWNIAALSLCTLLLVVCGMFMYDLARNMWSWDSPYSFNSALMDWILNLF